jgi:hypothetical protein
LLGETNPTFPAILDELGHDGKRANRPYETAQSADTRDAGHRRPLGAGVLAPHVYATKQAVLPIIKHRHCPACFTP